MTDLDAIRARLVTITPGAWGWEIVSAWGKNFAALEIADAVYIRVPYYENAVNDAQFIAHAPEDIAALLARIEALERETEACWRALAISLGKDRAVAAVIQAENELAEMEAEKE